jgi:hypothetical protein
MHIDLHAAFHWTARHALEIGATVSVPSAFVAWFAETLPVVQWLAAGVAITVGLLALWKHFRTK